jgi:energy-coupling factor transport system ATP-binding protein
MSMLAFDHVHFSYGLSASADTATIKDISFVLEKGEFAALIGENGAGKSTLCRLCNGLLKPSRGSVLAAGQDTRSVKTSILARKIGYLFQNPDRQLCQNTVRDEITFGLEYAFAGAFCEEEKNKRCDEMLSLFSLDGKRDPFGLSRGERQQAALASVLARKPELLVLDEPTTGLDYRECMNIMDIVSRLHTEGTTILMISHDMEVVSDFAYRALVLSKGRLIADGPVKEIMKNEEILDEASLLPPQIAVLARNMGTGFEDVFSVDDMITAVQKRNALL